MVLSKFGDFNDFNMKVMYWIFGMCGMVVYFILSLIDIVPMTSWICYGAFLYAYGGFFYLIISQL